MAGTIESQHDPVFRDHLYFNSLRGVDSTGVGGVYREWDKFEPTWCKALGGAWELLDDKKFDKFMKYYYCVLLGHNRSPTVGVSSIKNAHPFIHKGPYSKSILGMHNGTLEYCTKSDMKDGMSYGTDSEAIIANIAFEGPEKTIPKLEGAWALVWYDWQRHTINMIRNNKRPLFFVFSKDGRTMMWGSEWELMQAAAKRHYMQLDDPNSLCENVLMSWKIPDKDKEFGPPDETKIEGKAPFVNVGFHSPGSTSGNKSGNTGTQSTRQPLYGVSSSTSHPTNTNPTSTSGNASTGSNPNQKQSTPYQGMILTEPFKGCKDYGMFPDGQGGLVRLIFNPITTRWLELVRDKRTFNWVELLQYPNAPSYLPFSKLDVNSNHIWKHVGKKKKKQVFMLGWRGTLITQQQAETYFSFKCCACQRVPAWGNYVQWLDEEHNFLCEYCSMSEPLVNSWKDAS